MGVRSATGAVAERRGGMTVGTRPGGGGPRGDALGVVVRDANKYS